MKKKINVLFVIDEHGVTAVFPKEKHTNNPKDDTVVCYAHIGQHSACSPEWYKEQRQATYTEYQDLLRELRQVGYKGLNILNEEKEMPINDLIHVWYERYSAFRDGRRLDVVARNFIDSYLLPRYEPVNSLEYE